MENTATDPTGQPAERPWIVLTTTYDVEAWLDHFNRELQQTLEQAGIKPTASGRGHGLCLRLEHGGELSLHTTSEGDVLLDVTPEAEWVAPVISAATGIQPPRARLWALPSDVLTQLLLGLSSLIAGSRMVLKHDFKIRKW